MVLRKIGKADFISNKTINNLVEEGKNCECSSNRKEKIRWGNTHIFFFQRKSSHGSSAKMTNDINKSYNNKFVFATQKFSLELLLKASQVHQLQ